MFSSWPRCRSVAKALWCVHQQIWFSFIQIDPKAFALQRQSFEEQSSEKY